jgi:RNA polymerase sigma-70 factor (ECF subfamily)
VAAEDVRRAIDELPETFRSVVVLVLVEDLSYREAAEVLSVPIGTVMSRLHRGRRLLQRALNAAPGRSGIGAGGTGFPRKER